MAAASSGNQQPWRFVVVDDPVIRDRLGTLDVERGPYHVSPQLIVVCADIGSMKWKMHWLADCAAAPQNLLLAAHGLGLSVIGRPAERPEPLTSLAGRHLNNVHSPATLTHPKPAPSGPPREVAYMTRMLTS